MKYLDNCSDQTSYSPVSSFPCFPPVERRNLLFTILAFLFHYFFQLVFKPGNQLKWNKSRNLHITLCEYICISLCDWVYITCNLKQARWLKYHVISSLFVVCVCLSFSLCVCVRTRVTSNLLNTKVALMTVGPVLFLLPSKTERWKVICVFYFERVCVVTVLQRWAKHALAHTQNET